MSTSLPDPAAFFSVIGRARARLLFVRPHTGQQLRRCTRLPQCLPCSNWVAPPDAVALLAGAEADWRTPGCATRTLKGALLTVSYADTQNSTRRSSGARSCSSSGSEELHRSSPTDEVCCCATSFSVCACGASCLAI